MLQHGSQRTWPRGSQSGDSKVCHVIHRRLGQIRLAARVEAAPRPERPAAAAGAAAAEMTLGHVKAADAAERAAVTDEDQDKQPCGEGRQDHMIR